MITPITERPVTIEDVATVAGVSRAAVSKVIRGAYGVSPEMRERVQAAIDELGYRPRVSARGMRGSTYTLGVEIPDMFNQFFPKVISGATAALADTPYQLIIAPAGPDHDEGPQAIEALADRQVDGIVAISSRVPREWLEKQARRTPLVMLGRHDRSVNYDTLVDDDVAGARLAVHHLYDLGHRDIAHLTLQGYGPDARPGTPHALRVTGFQEAARELGVAHRARVIPIGPSQEDARQGALELLSGPSAPTAIFAAHDELALGVLAAVAELGLTAQDVSVVGYDDTEIAAHPLISLTSVNQSGTRMGEIAVRLLLERIAGRTEPVHEVITPRIMARRSTAPVAGDATLPTSHPTPPQA